MKRPGCPADIAPESRGLSPLLSNPGFWEDRVPDCQYMLLVGAAHLTDINTISCPGERLPKPVKQWWIPGLFPSSTLRKTLWSKCIGEDLLELQTEICRAQCNARPIAHYKMGTTGVTISLKVSCTGNCCSHGCDETWEHLMLVTLRSLHYPYVTGKKLALFFTYILWTILFGEQKIRIDRRKNLKKKKKNLETDCSHSDFASVWPERI